MLSSGGGVPPPKVQDIWSFGYVHQRSCTGGRLPALIVSPSSICASLFEKVHVVLKPRELVDSLTYFVSVYVGSVYLMKRRPQ